MTNASTYLQLRADAYDAAAERRRVARQLREATEGVTTDLRSAARQLVPETWESNVASIRREELAEFEGALARVDDDVGEIVYTLDMHAARWERVAEVYDGHYRRAWNEERQERLRPRD